MLTLLLSLAQTVPAFADVDSQAVRPSPSPPQAIASHEVEFRGWLEAGAVGNALPKPFILQDNALQGFKLNQLYLVVEKKVKTSEGFDWGFRVDNLLGEDWQIYHMGGFPVGRLGGQEIGWDPAQYYLEIHSPLSVDAGLDVQIGRFFALTGFQREAPYRPLYTTGYLYNYAQFFTYIGVMTRVDLTSGWKIHTGLVHSPDQWVGGGFEPNYAGAISWGSHDEKTEFSLAWHYGRQAGTSGSGAQIKVLNAVYIDEIAKNWSVVLEANVGSAPALAAKPSPSYGDWWGAAAWLTYDFSQTCKSVFRYEFFNDQNGSRTGVTGAYSGTTLGINYRPWHWLLFRPEIRFDWVQSSPPVSRGETTRLLFSADTLIEF